MITTEQWQQFETDGYLLLGKIASDTDLAALQQRMDDIMLGTAPLDYDRMLMQLDVVEGQDGPGPQSKGHKGATLNYRKIQDLEFDPLFLAYLQNAAFKNICALAHGANTPIACFRAMFMNKPAGKGHHLQWHQDRWTDLDKDPLITIWTALDPATVDNGCVKIIPGSHRSGLVNPDHSSGFLSEEQMNDLAENSEATYLELEAGEVVVLHNWLLHTSDVNKTTIPRRAFSVCYMDAATKSSRGHAFPRVFGEGALAPETLEPALNKEIANCKL